jgi:hypothetical protein
MTYPATGSQNQWGYFTAQSTYSYPAPVGDGVAPSTGNLGPPQSPSGSVTGESATFNFAETITSTEEFLTNVIEVDSAQQGAPALNASSQVTLAGVTNLAVNNWYTG